LLLLPSTPSFTLVEGQLDRPLCRPPPTFAAQTLMIWNKTEKKWQRFSWKGVGGGEGRVQTKAEAENLINCGTVTWLSEG